MESFVISTLIGRLNGNKVIGGQSERLSVI